MGTLMAPPKQQWLLVLAAFSAAAWAAPAKREPHIGYLYPGGGRRGAAFEITAGGQLLRGVSHVYVSGEGVSGKVVQYCRAFRNLQREQREELGRRLLALKEKRLAQLPNGDKLRKLRLPGERFGRKRAAKGKKAGDAAPTPAKPVKLPDHPLLRHLESKSLRELYHVADSFFNYKSFKKRQPNAQIAELVVIEVTIEPTATLGDRELRLGTRFGLTNPMCFQVGTLPEVCEIEPNDPNVPDPLPKEPAFDLPVALNGQIMPGDVDRFRFKAKRGQPIVVQTHARRLVPYLADAVPGWFQATVALYDAKGSEVAFADDYRFDPDPVLFYKIPADGEYELEIRDSVYRGREDFVYRVEVGELPFVTRMFPLGGRTDAKTVAAIAGWNLPRRKMRLDTRPGGDRIRQTALRQIGRVSNSMSYEVDPLPDCNEAEPNGSAKKAQPVALPRIVNGRIGRPGDVDVFRFQGRAGDEVVAEVLARRLQSPLDSLLRVIDSSGRVLEWNDDHVEKAGYLHKGTGLLTHHADSYVKARLPKDGVYYVQLADTQSHGGPAYAYRLRITPPQPDFALRMTPSSLSIPAGRLVPVTVHALRRDGFEGEIEVVLKDAPAGFVLSGGRIPKGRCRVCMTLTAPRKALDQPVALQLEGRAHPNGRTIRRPVTPADDVMQAFLYRHLAPAQELMVVVTKNRWTPLPVQVSSREPVQVPAGGKAEVRIKTPTRPRLRTIELALAEPMEGVALQDVRIVPDGLAFVLKVEGDAAPAGFADNLIVEAFTERPVKRRDKKGKKGGKATGQTRRVSLGLLPAIPFVVVPPDGVAR